MYSNMSKELLLMGSGILPVVEYCYLGIQIQIGLAMQLTGKVPLVIALVWDQKWSLGPAGSRFPYLRVQLR